MNAEQHDRIMVILARETCKVLGYKESGASNDELDEVLRFLSEKSIINYSFSEDINDFIYFLTDSSMDNFDDVKDDSDESVALVARTLING